MPTLVPVEEPYTEEQVAGFIASLQTRGYCVLPDVWERESVSAYERRIRELAGPGARYTVHAQPISEEDAPNRWWLPNDVPEFVEPIRASRIRSFLLPALIPSPEPRSKIQCFEQAWVVDPGTDAQHWHKDYNHSGRPGEKLPHYLYPENIYLAIYFCDMTEADGPTQVIPGSHIDPTLVPEVDSDAEGTPTALASFATRKQDVVVWDQRCWHRRGPGGGGPDHPRILSIYGFQTQQTVGSPAKIHPALARAWLEAENDEDALYFGGRWSADSIVEEVAALRAERDAAVAELADIKASGKARL